VGYRAGKADVMMQRYPVTGGKNPIVKAGIVDVATRKTTWVRWGKDDGAERYLGRFAWSADGQTLWVQTLSRDQKRPEPWKVDPQRGAATAIVHESSPTWIEFAEMKPLDKQPRFVWSTVTAGHRHLEVREAASGARVAALTSGGWDVEAVKGVDEDRGRVL